MTGLPGELTPVSRPVHGEHNVAKRHPLDIRRRHSTNHQMQFQQFGEGTYVTLNGLEFEDIAAALPVAANQLRSAAQAVEDLEQRGLLTERAERFDLMVAEMHFSDPKNLSGLASSLRFPFLRCTSDDDQLPEEE